MKAVEGRGAGAQGSGEGTQITADAYGVPFWKAENFLN